MRVILLGLAASATIGCTAAGRPASLPAGRGPTPEYMEMGASPTGATQGSRLLVRTASASLEVERLLDAESAVTALAARLGGYVESVRRDEHDAQLSLRVPAAALLPTLDSLERIGRVKNRSVTATDVTEEVQDVEARVETLRATRDRLRQLLGRAASVTEIAAVERELGRVQGDLDVLEGRQKSLRSNVALARVTVDLRQRRVLGPLGIALAGVAWVVEKLFVLR